jgi:hypothetical protein
MNPFLGMGLVIIIILLFGGTFGTFVYTLTEALVGI